MGRMVRKQIYIEPEQDALLKRRAAELGVTESELIRRGIEQIARKPVDQMSDHEAWGQSLAFMRARGNLPSTGAGRGWTREELYDRQDRFSR
jgi:hypothetical protein